MTVVDASVAVDALLNSDTRDLKSRLKDDSELHAPHLIDGEVAHVVRKLYLAGDFDEKRGREALSDLAAFPVMRHPHYPFLGRVWELRHDLSAYDALYVVLAEALDARLLTRDKRLAAVAKRYVAVDAV